MASFKGGPFSLVTLLAHRWMTQREEALRREAWYHNPYPNFSATLAPVRKELRAYTTFCGSSREPGPVKVPQAFVKRLAETFCYGA